MNTLYTILIVVAFFIPFIIIFRLKNKFGPSYFDDIFFFDDKILIFSNVYHSGGDGDSFTDCRISILNKKNGKIEKIIIPKAYYKFKIICKIDNILWLKDESFAAFDLNRLEIVFEQKKIGQKYPQLKGIGIKDFFFNEIEKKICFLAEDGLKYQIDPNTFEISITKFENMNYVVKKRISIEKKNVLFSFKKISGTERCQLMYDNNEISKDKSFIKPTFIFDSETKIIVETENPKGVVFIHYDSLNNLALFNLTLISKDGFIIWNINQVDTKIKNKIESERKAEIIYSHFSTPYLYIIFEGKKFRMLCIEINKGTIVWNYLI